MPADFAPNTFLPDDEPTAVAVLRASTPRHLVTVASELARCGLLDIELTLTTPDIEEVWGELRSEVPGIRLGIGSVRTAEDVARANELATDFIVTPVCDSLLLDVLADQQTPFVPGALTPSEIARCMQAGAHAVKVFPAVTVGPQYFTQVLAPMPDARLMPSGGIDAAAIPRWITAGAIAVSLGGALTADSLETGDVTELSRRATFVMQQLRPDPQ